MADSRGQDWLRAIEAQPGKQSWLNTEKTLAGKTSTIDGWQVQRKAIRSITAITGE